MKSHIKKAMVCLLTAILFVSSAALYAGAAKTVALIAGLKAEVSGKNTFDYFFHNENKDHPEKSVMRLTDGDASDDGSIYFWQKDEEANYDTTSKHPIELYLTYTLPKNSTIVGFDVIPRDQGINYELQYSMDKSNWKTAHEVKSSGWRDEVAFSKEVQAKYVRFYFKNCSVVNAKELILQLKELSVLGYTSTANAPASQSTASARSEVPEQSEDDSSDTSNDINNESSETGESSGTGALDSVSSITGNASGDGMPGWVIILIAAGAVLLGGCLTVYILWRRKAS